MPQIGFSLGLAAYLLVRGYKHIVVSFKSLARASEADGERKFPSLRYLVAMYLLGTVGSVATFHILVPDFPVLIPAVISVGFSFVNALLTTRALGETAYPLNIPYVWQSAISFTTYQGLNAYLIPPTIGGMYTMEGGSPSWTQMVKVAYLTETKPMDIIKALVIAISVYQVFSFIYVDFFWRIAPIPSSVYPYAMIQWPIMIINESVWITRAINTNYMALLGSAGLMAAICVLGDLLTKLAGIAFPATALVTGFLTIPTFTIPVFLGAMLSRFVMPRFLGRKNWDENKSIIAAGMWAGEGIIVGISIGAALIFKATWIWPW